jgi:hypothetical protein
MRGIKRRFFRCYKDVDQSKRPRKLEMGRPDRQEQYTKETQEVDRLRRPREQKVSQKHGRVIEL